MGTVNFYLKEPQKKAKKKEDTQIYLQFVYSTIKLRYFFGQTIHPDKWNEKKQRVKSNEATTADGKRYLNELLDSLERVLLTVYNKELKDGFPAKDVLKKHLDEFMHQRTGKVKTQETLYTLIQKFISGEIKYKGQDREPNTLKKYNTVYNHLRDFEQATKYPIDFETINLDFYNKYISFLRKPRKGIGRLGKIVDLKPLRQNSVAKEIQVIKVFMNWAVKIGLTKNVQHQSEDFAVVWEDTDAVYLSEEDINQLYQHDLGGSKKLQQARDLFVLGCYTGLRFGDYSSISTDNKRRHTDKDGEEWWSITVRTKKTGELVVIPCHELVLDIFDRYKDQPRGLPKKISNQKFNEYVKEACQLAGLTERGRLMSNPDLALWECVSSHTARRSFATNLYLQGFPPNDIMKITGHKTEQSFKLYIRVTKLDAAKRLNTHMKTWQEKLLRIVA